VVSSENFGIGAGLERRSSKGIRLDTRGNGRTQMAGERFFKIPIAVIVRHGFLLS
jgi:hypothetical protein